MSDLPELRRGPPWVMEEMIAAEPDLARSLFAARDVLSSAAMIAAAIRDRDDGHATGPVTIVGCGTSEHAAMAIAALLRLPLPDAVVNARQAFEAALEPARGGLCLAISHEGESAATMAALTAAHRAGAGTALITGIADAPATKLADHVLVTHLKDLSWCHTVGYLSPMLAGALITAELRGEPLDGTAMETYLRRCLELGAEAATVADALWGIDRLVICGSGVDRGSAREFALKVEEGLHMPAVGRDLETELHGHMVSADARCGLVVIATEPRHSAERVARAGQLLLAARRLGMPTAAIVSAEIAGAWPVDSTSAGRLVLPDRGENPPILAALTGAAIALQLLTVGLVHAAGTNPDRIRREEDAYRESAALA